jgi:transcription elongation factor Elf1
MSNCPRCGSKNTEWTDCKTVENRTIVVCVCSDCGHSWEQSL